MSNECSNCGWQEVICYWCHVSTGRRGWIQFSLEELKDLQILLDQCESEGYLNYGNAAYDASQKINDEIEKLENDDG